MTNNTNSSSLTRQLQVVFAISILLLLVSSYASYYTNRKLIDTSLTVDHTNEVILEAEKLISLVKDAETSQRGYLLTGDAQFLDPYKAAPERVMDAYDHLRVLTSDNATQQRNLTEIKKLIDDRFLQMQNVLDKARVTNSVGDIGLLQSGSYDEILRGKRIMDNLRLKVKDIRDEETRLLEGRKEDQQTFITYTPIVVIIAAIMAVLISVMAYVRIKADLDERIKKQKEEQEKYFETARRIALLEDVTRKIAAGEFEARSTDSEEDELGRISLALNEMAVSLESNFHELEKRNWLQEGAMSVSESMSGARHLRPLANNVISTLAGYIAAPVGTLYLADDDMNLKLTGSYAISGAPAYLGSGEGLTGQALLGKGILVSDELPAGYLKISSSTGSTTPVHVVAMPLLYEDEPIGVVELGMLRKPTDTELAFLYNNAEAIAIGINTARNYEKIQNLLEETQAQSEELQAQHSELENINTELQAQAEKLQASEEELRVQQEALQEANQELEERTRMLEDKNIEITDRNMEVQQKAEELAQSTKYKSEFLANMSHELRTPLNSILLLSRLLAENNEANLSTEQIEYAKVIQNSGYGLLSLIDEILDLSKIEAGKMDVEYQKINISSVASDMKGLFAPLAQERNLLFEVYVDKELPEEMETDKMKLEQIIKNLVSNALKFTSIGHVKLDIRKQDDKTVCFEVSDTGIGIPDDKQKLIFEAFRQADGTTRRKYGGTGLGLSISRELVKLLGGRIELYSSEGKGSTFMVYIPITKKYAAVAEPAEPSPERDNMAESVKPAKDERFISPRIPESIPDDRDNITESDKVVLIVEDDIPFAKSISDYTRKNGYKCIVAVRGDEGVALAHEYKPRCILLDLQLPVKSGWEVMDELKSNPETRHIPIHMMSSHSVKNESLVKGAVDFVNKPMAYEQMREIFDKLETVLNRKSKKVLIVEENTKHAKALANFLEDFRISAEIKHTVQDSINAFSNDADCVILDMGIPDQKAYDMLEQIKSRPDGEHIPIIIFTGKSLSLSEEQKIKQYADSIVVKTAHSYKRILDEVKLFLHLVEEAPKKGSGTKKPHTVNEVLKDKTVLVVDDDVRNIFSLTKSLEAMQMKIVTAVNGKEAMTKLEENKSIDVVLLDMMMPEMDGYETAKAIRREKKWKNLPVIAVTAKAMIGDREKCIKAGASDYISKPVDVDQLLSLLRVWLYD